MTPAGQQFPFVERDPGIGELSRGPYLPLALARQQQTVEGTGLLDTGAAVNVLPYSLGLQLGAVWEQQTTPVRLRGNLANYEARGVVLLGPVGQFAPVRLVFAWTATDDVPVILGMMNFFLEYDVCFYRSRLYFELRPASKPTP